MLYRKMSSIFARDVNKAIALAASRLGYVQFRPEQKKKAVREFVNGSDVFVSLPKCAFRWCVHAPLNEFSVEG